MDSFCNRLNEAMKIRDMRAIDLASETGISKARISQYVNGVYEAKQTALYLLARALHVSEAWLMGYDVPMEKEATETLSPHEEALLSAYRSAHPATQEAVCRVLGIEPPPPAEIKLRERSKCASR